MQRTLLCCFLLCATANDLCGQTTLRVPADYASIQAAIDSTQPGDCVLVAPGHYLERIRLRPKITVRSAGGDGTGKLGLARAEVTILDGGGDNGPEPGVAMAEGSTLDGFTVTRVGSYDEALWQHHHDTHGEELGDDEGAVQAEGTTPAISIREVECTVINNIVHHNGDVGISVLGSGDGRQTPRIAHNISCRNLGGGIGIAGHSEAVVTRNRCYENLRAGIGCRNASPLIIDNHCYLNIRAGIGCREQSTPVIRGNTCDQNRRAGIGIRMAGTSPVVEQNKCFENAMAGIGCRDGASPLICRNRCDRNRMAGIGCDGAKAMILNNTCHANAMAGISVRGKGSATIEGNKCIENKLVAIGVIQESQALLAGNHCMRSNGVPPIIAIKDQSNAVLNDNEIVGGGVAAVLVQGSVRLFNNRMIGRGHSQENKQGTAVWVWEGSDTTITSNTFHGYLTAVKATGSQVFIDSNHISDFRDAAILVKDSREPAHVLNNVAVSDRDPADTFQLEGPVGVNSGNRCHPVHEHNDSSDD